MKISLQVPNHIAHRPRGIVLERIRNLSVGGKMADLPPHLQHNSFIRTGNNKTGGPNLRIIRLESNKPSLTVTAYIFNKFVHQVEDRYITPREAACLQDFPDEYEFVGSISHVQQQVGNAVPVKLANIIGHCVLDYLSNIGVSGEVPIASYFCGAGGFDLGFERVKHSSLRFTTMFATDIDKSAIETINTNRPQWNPALADIRELSPNQVKRIIDSENLVVIGGPPCQPFSVAGKQLATEDPLGKLYRNFVSHISSLSPKIVVMENVYGLAQVKKSNVLAEIYKAFHDIGYCVEHRELFAPDYGTPQKRRRLFFIATQEKYSEVRFQFPDTSFAETVNIFGLPRYHGAGETMAHLPPPPYRD